MLTVFLFSAGVLGLTSALELLKKGHDVSIVGRHIPGDLDSLYTSPWAGANWGSFAGPDEYFLQDLDKPGYKKFFELARNDPSAGVHIVPHHTYITKAELERKGRNVTYPWFINFVEGFRELDQSELPKTGDIVKGWTFDSVTISTTLYLNYLLQKIFKLGGTLRRKEVKHIKDAYALHHTGSKADIVINCTGLLARRLKGVEDQDVYPIRGQILWVRNNATKQIVVPIEGYANESLYIFPRKEGGCIIGGTFIVNDWSTIPDPELSKRMIERAKKYLPELVDPKLGNDPDIDVFRHNVGLRPARKNGPKIEREGSIIHNYGISGAGYQASYGLAEHVTRLVDEYLKREAKL